MRQLQDAWCQDVSPYRAIEFLLAELERGAFLSHGRYNDRCMATLVRDSPKPDQLVNAVSGWGKTPAGALVVLAFNWCVLCKESWVTASCIRLKGENANAL